MTTFADLITVKSYDGSLQRRLTALGLSAQDEDAIAAEVAAEAGPEGAVITEQQAGYDPNALAPHWRRLSGALRKAEATQRKELEASEEDEAAAEETASYLDKETSSSADSAAAGEPFDPQRRDERLKALINRYRPTKVKTGTRTKSKSRTRTVTEPQTGAKSHACSCNGSCGDCQFDQCTRLGQRLQELDAALAITHQELQLGALARLTKSLAEMADSSISVTPRLNQDVNTVCLKIKMFNLRSEREAVWDKMCQTGCRILRADRATSAS
jgi:hypothetical protein